ncbi:hypothetical protein Zm00014a_029322 [Zea mays]|uniref:Uncharacterized protein n=1 Tax=Zea mays TaxID=4577 RepID=A0A3L6EBQ0_MAIZE|nr:hypothetical protein Zm00014a_029322 [Zea mays]
MDNDVQMMYNRAYSTTLFEMQYKIKAHNMIKVYCIMLGSKGRHYK